MYHSRYPSFVVCLALATAKLSFGTSSVIVEPAATNTSSPIVTGATKLTLQPTNESLPTIVLNLFSPS